MRESRMHDPRAETRSPGDQRAFLDRRLRETIARAGPHTPALRRALATAGLEGAPVGLDELPRLPVTRKDALMGLQAAEPPLGGLLCGDVARLQRLYASPGPTYVPQGAADDYWRFGPAFAATGFRAGDVVLNTLSYHLTPGGFMLDSGLRSLGCVVIPAGVGQTDLQIRVASALRATGYAGTPSFLLTLLERARELGTPLFFEAAFATAEMLPDSLRAGIEAFGVRVSQGYATADLGVLAYECPERAGLHVSPDCIVELIDPETGREAAAGEAGEVVGTIFDESYPLVRFATGDLSAWLPAAACACGRTARRLKGVVGRVGDALKVKGMFVRASQLDEALKAFPDVARLQAVVTREGHHDRLTYRVEPRPGASLDPARLGDALREAVKVRGEIELVEPGTIPSGARRLEDRRVWK